MLGFIVKMVLAGAAMQWGMKAGDWAVQRAKEKFPPSHRNCLHCKTGVLESFEVKNKKGVVTSFGLKCLTCKTEFEGKVPAPGETAAPAAQGN